MTMAELQKRHRDENWLEYAAKSAYAHAHKRAGRLGLPFLITPFDARQLIKSGECALSGIPFRRAAVPGIASPYSPSIDRIRPGEGYVPGNVRFILHALNDAKGSGTDDDLIDICHRVAERHPIL